MANQVIPYLCAAFAGLVTLATVLSYLHDKKHKNDSE